MWEWTDLEHIMLPAISSENCKRENVDNDLCLEGQETCQLVNANEDSMLIMEE